MDKSDVELSLERDADDLCISAMWRGRRVGYARCSISGNRMEIDDLKVDNEHSIPWPVLHRFLIRLGFKARRRSFRTKGIGSLLLKRVLGEAEAMEIEEVWGSVTEDDAKKTRFLLAWYERHGFSVTQPDAECIATAFRKITRKRKVEVS